MLPLHQRLVDERGDPDRGPGDGRQPAGTARPDPVHLARADGGDGRAGIPRPRQQRRSRGQGQPLPLAQDLGGEVAAGLAQSCAGDASPSTTSNWPVPRNGESEAIEAAQAIQRELRLPPMERPFVEACEQTIEPKEAERSCASDLPPSQKNFTSDDYTEYCWHAPTVRFYIGRPMLKAPSGICLSRLGDECAGRHPRLYRSDDRHGRPAPSLPPSWIF